MKKKVALVFSLILMSVLALSLASCGKEAEAAQTTAVASGSGSPTLDRILEAGVIKIGVGTGGAPMGFTDDNGQPIGYDIDWGNKLAETLGVKAEFVTVNGETRIPALQSGRIDVILCNITGTLERAKTIDFSIPYVLCGVKMLTKADSKYTTVDSLNVKGVKVACNRGTTAEALVMERAPLAEIVYVTTFAEQLLLVEQGKVDATFEDSTVIDYAAMNSNGLLKSQPEQYTSDPLCIGMLKGDLEFVRWMDMFISWNITQGWQAETYRKWWGTDPAPLKTLW